MHSIHEQHVVLPGEEERKEGKRGKGINKVNKEGINSLGLSDASVTKTIIASENSLLPVWCQAIIWTNKGLFLYELSGTNFSAIGMINFIQ